MKKCAFVTNFAASKHHFFVFGDTFNWCLFGGMNTRVEKNLFVEMFLSCIWLWEYENCLSELADVTGQLKATCATL